ncbi:alpha/beta hydrolase [Facklamia sp. DSM 111018]|uniref:Alpha/beta hydrolase n=1 Tax=Facklamia lactis TaxID=2749967 RepID=A0ABS0LRG1_9LACT|nr:alpha/beta hydrolase [Facklamia lactis]MBG9981015.1 alpha/beta hydrolase [Facklamia lactis]MBG9986622.1 alpha/beta hydrolase [Facklamia lactis]
MSQELIYEHIYQPGKEGESVFVLLHGTGGSEKDLIPIAREVDSDFGILAVKGDVEEEGKLRFFKRKALGLYDVEDLMMRGARLEQFIEAAANYYGFNLEQVILMGFSNGANIAINVLMRPDTVIRYGVLMAPMYPVAVGQDLDCSHQHVFISMGNDDPIVSREDSQRVVKLFENRGAQIEEFWVRGHEITPAVVTAIQEWLETF